MNSRTPKRDKFGKRAIPHRKNEKGQKEKSAKDHSETDAFENTTIPNRSTFDKEKF